MCIRDRDKIAPGTANEDTLLYGVEVKFYNMEVEVNKKLESKMCIRDREGSDSAMRSRSRKIVSVRIAGCNPPA